MSEGRESPEDVDDGTAATVDAGSSGGESIARSATIDVRATLIDRKVGNFTVERLIGEGAMGSVYLARHDSLARRVAIKVLQPQVLRHEGLVRRFIDEAHAVSSLGHAGLVQIFDFGRLEDGQLYAVMEYLEGRDLEAELAARGTLSPPRAVGLALQIAAALAAVHDQGIVHRDLKPANLFLCRDGDGDGDSEARVKILDFGIAKLLERDDGESPRTAVGHIVGTPEYMAPEQAEATGEVDRRIDVYALGCVLYEMLAGRPPFVSRSVPSLLVAHLSETPRPVGEVAPGVPAELEAVVMRCLAKSPDGRFADMRALAAALEPLRDLPGATAERAGAARKPTARGGWLIVAALTAVALTAAALAVILGGPRKGAGGGGVGDESAAVAASDAGVGGGAARNPYASLDAPAVAAGAAIWSSHCARCHGIRGEGDGADTPPGLEPRAFADMTVEPGVLDVYRFEIVRRGIGDRMPSFAGELSDDEIWKVVTFVGTLAPPVAVAGEPVPDEPAFTAELVATGAELFGRKCSSCHGEGGEGDGRAAAYLGRPPADLTAGVYKLRSTPKGALPTRADLFRTLTSGMGVRGMPSFARLSVEERWALVAFTESLAPRFATESPGEVLEIPPAPSFDAEAVRRGRAAYQSAGCRKCHGDEGRGDGELAPRLEDYRGRPLALPDFTVASTLVGGETQVDVYRVMMTGVSGTPMPEGSDFFDPAEAWDVVAYIMSLSGGAP